ncbi:MAG: glycosyltransferase [Thermoguttaceae bacterium]
MRAAVDLIFATPDEHVGWMLPALKAALTLVRRHRPQAIYCTSPPHSANLIAVALKKITGLPLVTDFRDPWARPEWGRKAQQTLRDQAQARLERLCVERSDRVILNTPRLRDEFRAAYPGKSADTLLTIPNGYDPEMLHRIQRMISEHGHESANGSIRICHAGSVYGERDLRPLAAAVRGLLQSGHNVSLEQIGPTDRQAEIARYTRENHLEDHITFQGWLPHEQTLERLAVADVVAVIQPGTTLQVPAKLFELLLFRKPILALTGQGATADIINGFGLGRVADPGDSQAISAAILLAANKQSRCNDTGSDQALCAFDGRRLTGELAQVLDSLL